MEYISRILILILMGTIYVLPGYLMYKIINLTFQGVNKFSLIVLLIGLTTFPMGNILVRWRLNRYTSFVELLGGICLYFCRFISDCLFYSFLFA